jgi:transcriptional regulator with XRE-family HTH domain
MAIGPRVRERRKQLGFTQEYLAAQTGVTLSAVQRLEGGRITDPHYSTLSSIAEALGTTVAELVGEENFSVSLGDGPEEGRAIFRTVRGGARVTDEVRTAIFGHLDALEAALKTHSLNGELLDMVEQMRKKVAA